MKVQVSCHHTNDLLITLLGRTVSSLSLCGQTQRMARDFGMQCTVLNDTNNTIFRDPSCSNACETVPSSSEPL